MALHKVADAPKLHEVASAPPYRIICLGCCCSASFRLIEAGLKQESSIVEWLNAVDFADVLYLLRAALDPDATRRVRVLMSPRDRTYTLFEGTGIGSRHYPVPADLEERYMRRAARLRAWIDGSQSQARLIFVRHEGRLPTTRAQLRAFDTLLRSRRPDVAYDFVLFTPPSLYRPRFWGGLSGVWHFPLPRDIEEYKSCIERVLSPLHAM